MFFEVDLRIRTTSRTVTDKPIRLDSSFEISEEELNKLLKVVNEISGVSIELND